jgi:hypothetical protein
VRYKQGREALERQVRDLEADLKGAHEVRRGAERALEEAQKNPKVPCLWTPGAGGPLRIGSPTQGAVNHAALGPP